jgi:hypothetical protein
LKLSFQSS